MRNDASKTMLPVQEEAYAMSMSAEDGHELPPADVDDWDIAPSAPLFCVGARKKILSRLHSEKLALCNLLEEIADSLPRGLDQSKCVVASIRLEPLIRAVHTYEEDVLFPAYVRAQGNTPHALEMVARLKVEHIEDADFAAELAERLRRAAQGLDGLNVDALGYMLRGFFSGMRRHIANEREALAPFLNGGGRG